jgi:hypothetical protein
MLIEQVEYVEIKIGRRIIRLKAPQVHRLRARRANDDSREVYMVVGIAEKE